jgi:hypothetical protein
VTTPEQHHEPQQPSAIGRRRLVRTGAALAWTVPAISLATAVPAYAVSGCCHLTVSGTAAWRANGLNYFDLPLSITNSCAGSVTGLSLILTVCGVKDVQWAGTEYLPTGWTQLGKPNTAAPSNGHDCYTLTFLTALAIPGKTTITPKFTGKSMAYVGTGNHRPAGTITALLSTAGCTAPSTVIALPKVG